MNNLTQREKILIYMIIGIVPILVVFFGFNWFMGQLKAKSLELNTVNRQLSDIELRADMAIVKTQLKNELKQRSLPPNENVAQGEYREWLRTLAEDDIKFLGPPKVTSKSNTTFKSDFGPKAEIYTQLGFQLDCKGSYQQIVDFLYRFYEKNYIHRITRLDLTLAKGRVEGKVTYDRNRFNIKAEIQVLSLVDADDERNPLAVQNTKLFYQSATQNKLISDLEDYQAIVLRRNLFGFPNNAPDFGSRKKEFKFEEGDRISLRLSADDEDDDDLEYVLESTDGKVSGEQIEQSRSGSFKLDIKELGAYEFIARVVDKNYYPKTDDMQVVVKIEEKEEPKKEDPKPKPPAFDPLKFTFLEAIVRNFEGTPTCWINVRPFGKMHKVNDGAKFDIGKKEIEVIKINRRNAVIAIDGDQYLFAVNDSLGDPQGEMLVSAKTEEKSKVDGERDDSESAPKGLDVNTENPNPSPAEEDSEKSTNSSEPKEDSKAEPESSKEDANSKDDSTSKSKEQPGPDNDPALKGKTTGKPDTANSAKGS